jgi:hypothetical protein
MLSGVRGALRVEPAPPVPRGQGLGGVRRKDIHTGCKIKLGARVGEIFYTDVPIRRFWEREGGEGGGGGVREASENALNPTKSSKGNAASDSN